MSKEIQTGLDRHRETLVLISSLRNLIEEARQKALRAVDLVQVQTCWEIGRHMVEFEQGGLGRAEYGRGFWRRSAMLAADFGYFDESTCGICVFSTVRALSVARYVTN